jgi:transposase
LAVELYEHGMSLRAIAQPTGQSKSTVGRQVSQIGTAHDKTGLDSKTYRHNGGRRGPLTAKDRLSRAEKLIRGANFAGIDADLAS